MIMILRGKGLNILDYENIYWTFWKFRVFIGWSWDVFIRGDILFVNWLLKVKIKLVVLVD